MGNPGFLFFLVLGLGLDGLGPATGVYTVVIGAVTTVAAFMVLLNSWSGERTVAIVIAAAGLLALAISSPAARALVAPAQEVVD